MADNTTCSGTGDVVEIIVAELRKRRPFFEGLRWPGKVIIHVNPENREEPVRVEAHINV